MKRVNAVEYVEELFRKIRDLEQENEVLRKAAERYWRVREDAQQDVDGYNNETPVLVHAVSHTTGWRESIDSAIDSAIAAHDAISYPENPS